MSSRNKFFSIVFSAFAMLILSTFVLAQDTSKTTTTTPGKADRKMHRPGQGPDHFKFGRPGFDRRGGFDRGAGMQFRGIDLTDAQKAQINSIRESNKPDRAAMEELRTIARARREGTLTDAQKARAEEIGKTARARAESVHQQMLGVLTADQKTKIEERKTQMKQRMEEFRKQRELRKQQRTTAPVEKRKVV